MRDEAKEARHFVRSEAADAQARQWRAGRGSAE